MEGKGDEICIDDEEVPSINGTGAEDYFNHAWGMQRNQSPYNGTIIHDMIRMDIKKSYRFHLTDPIHFKNIFRLVWNMDMRIIYQTIRHVQHIGIKWLSNGSYDTA